jgi:hypothetical protein
MNTPKQPFLRGQDLEQFGQEGDEAHNLVRPCVFWTFSLLMSVHLRFALD